MKILGSAYACWPQEGSEPGIGWNWAKEMARFHDVWIVTRSNNREFIEGALNDKILPKFNWIFVDLPSVIKYLKIERKSRNLYYYLWQLFSFFKVRKIHKIQNFELIHHMTYGNYWRPVFLTLLGSKIIWGPVGGGESTPKKFLWAFGPNAF